MNGIEYIMIVVPVIILESLICAYFGVRWMKVHSIKPASSKFWIWIWLQLFGYSILGGFCIFAVILIMLCLLCELGVI